MTSPLSNFFENVSLSSSYDGLSSHQILFNLDQGKQSYGGGGGGFENVLNRPGEIGLKVPWVTISNKSNRNEKCHVIYSMTTMSKISVSFSPRNNTYIISSLNTSKVVRPVQSLSTFA